MKIIKDERKKETVMRVDQRLDEINARMTDHFSDVIGKLEEMLGRISERSQKAENNGVDIAAVKSAIASAQTALTAAQTAIKTQSAKTYVITVTTETKLKDDVSKSKKALQDDLEKVKKTVFNARSAVQKAAVTLGQIPNVDQLEIPSAVATSSSATQ